MDEGAQSSLQLDVDKAVEDLKCWDAVLPFDIAYENPFTQVLDKLQHRPNILVYTDLQYIRKRFFFSKDKYPPSQPLQESFAQLQKDLKLAAFQGGSEIVSNGRNGRSGLWDFACKRFRPYKGKKNASPTDGASTTTATYRQTTLHADKKNSRGRQGKSQCRRTTATRPVLGMEDTCKMKFYIGFDSEKGFYLSGGAGCSHHNGHLRLNPEQITLPTKLIAKEDGEIINQVHKANALHATGKNVHFVRTGRLLDRSQVRYFNSKMSRAMAKEMQETDQDAPDESSDIDQMLRYLRAKGIAYNVLSEHSKCPDEPSKCEPLQDISNTSGEGASESGLVNETFDMEDEGNKAESELKLPNTESKEMRQYAEEHRSQYQLTPEQKLTFSVAWVDPKERRKFRQFPEVLHIDATSDSNEEDRPLLTITGQDANGRMFTIMRVFLPNEQAWMFRWIFQTAMPILLGEKWMSRIRVIISDGDSQEIKQLDAAIQLFFPQVMRVRCGWHIIDRGWKSNGCDRKYGIESIN